MMKRIVLEHLTSFLVVFLLFVFVLSVVRSGREALATEATRLITPYLEIDSIDVLDPLQAALFKESLRAFYPNEESRNDSIIAALDAYALRSLTDPERKSGRWNGGLSSENMGRLLWMYAQFVGIYAAVIVLTHIGARMAAVHKFVRMKQGVPSSLRRFLAQVSMWAAGKAPPGTIRQSFFLLVRAMLKGILLLVLFSPAYVIAYAFKTELDTSSLLFMILLALISNGLLINSTNKFYTFLVHESRKGYVETAMVKGLDNVYQLPSHWSDRLTALLMPLRVFSNHVFRHLFINARFQYIPAIKEHAAFVITGLIIIEMALNIQGHLCYELLQSLLFKDYEVAVAIVLGIFLAVKVTELSIDIWHYRENSRYQNISAPV